MSLLRLMGLIALLAIDVAFLGCGNEGHNRLSAEEAQRMMASEGNCIVVDVRSREEYDKRHIPRALWLPIEDIRRGHIMTLKDKNQPLLVYCWTGRRSEEAAEILTKLGYTRIYDIGGLVDWPGETVGEE